jgi:hypothetical protein
VYQPLKRSKIRVFLDLSPWNHLGSQNDSMTQTHSLIVNNPKQAT